MQIEPDDRPPTAAAMAERTLRLVVVTPTDPYPRKIASGLLIPHGKKPRVISAGHALLDGNQWSAEVASPSPTRTLCVPLYDVEPLGIAADDVRGTVRDIAWASLDIEAAQRQLEAVGIAGLVDLDLKFYQGPLDSVPRVDSEYSFCSMSRVEAHPDGQFIVREPAVEDGMRYAGRRTDSGLYIFNLAAGHAGHSYYRGSSGSPIVAQDGTVVSLVINGSEEHNVVYGIPLADFSDMLAA